jgi:uncharacterized membrane protein
MKTDNHGGKQRFIEPFLLGAFLFWLAAGLITTCANLTLVGVENWNTPVFLKRFVAGCIRVGDPLLIFLAAINVYLAAVRQWGLTSARRWAFGVVMITGIVETVGTKTGFPFGSYYYTANFGPRIAGVLPVTIPLAWLVIVTSLILIFRQAQPQAGRILTAAVVATGATLLDAIMEPFATQIKMYWLWEGGVIPLQNYLAWWVVTFGLVLGLLPRREQLTIGRDWRPHLVLGGIVVLFGVTRFVFSV